jgi:hypothetical protein
MPFRESRFIAVLVATSILAPSFVLFAPEREAHAQGRRKPLREQLPDEATRKQYDAAIDLAKHGQWDGARTAFYAIYESTKNVRVLFNVAAAEKGMGRYGRAIDMFRRELSEGKGTLAPDEEAEIKQEITKLEPYVASLTIEVNEPGADVFLDDGKIGVSPLPGPVSVQVGERRVRAVKPGYAEANESRDLKAGSSTTFSLKLVPTLRTSLVVISIDGPQNADILVDGKFVGTARADKPYEGQIGVSAEPHQFSAQSTGWVTATQPIVVRDNEKASFTFHLGKDQEKGKLLVVTKPEGATIELDGTPVGTSRWEGPVDTNKPHQVLVKKQGYYNASFNDISVPKGGERSVTAVLNEDRNTSFVPWLIGTIVVVGAGAVAAGFIFKPKDEDRVNGSLSPYTVPTPGMHRF